MIRLVGLRKLRERTTMPWRLAPPSLSYLSGRITSETLNQQWDLALLIQQWTHNLKDWPMFNKLDNDDPGAWDKNDADGHAQILVLRVCSVAKMDSGNAP